MAMNWVPLGPAKKPCKSIVTKDASQFYDIHIAEWADYSGFLEQGQTYDLNHIISHQGENLYFKLSGTAFSINFDYLATSNAAAVTAKTLAIATVANNTTSVVQFHIKKVDSSRFIILYTWNTDADLNAYSILYARMITLESYVSATNATTGVKTNTLKAFVISSALTVRAAANIGLATTAAAYTSERYTRMHPYDESLASEDMEAMMSRKVRYYSKADVCTGDRIYYNGIYMNNVSSVALMSGGWVLATSVNPSTGLSHIKRTNENSKYGFGYYNETKNASGAITTCSGGFVHRIGGSRKGFYNMIINNVSGLASNGVYGDNAILLDNDKTARGNLLGLLSDSSYVYFKDDKLYFLTYGPIQNVFNIIDSIDVNTELCGVWGTYDGHSDFYLKDNMIIVKIKWNDKEMYSLNQIIINSDGTKSIYHIGKIPFEINDEKYNNHLFSSEGFGSRLYGTRECY